MKTLKSNPFKHILRGIEKECLRVSKDGDLSKKGHPEVLGKSLTHPRITTDFAESLLEFVTPVYSDVTETLTQLKHIQNHVLQHIEDELIYPASMPTHLPNEEEINIADFGSSHTGQLKKVYRKGLAHRYGKSMQTIAGIHYNFSVTEELMTELYNQSDKSLSYQDYKTQRYFGLIRNFLRYEWLLIYLFGACPALDESFVKDKDHNLEKFGKNTFIKQYATSLRMSDLGYTSNAQNNLHVCYDSLENYLDTLSRALTFPYRDYLNIGNPKEGEFEQINSHLLQIENEFYSTIRPKRVTKKNERPLDALGQRGVEYIEVRLLDINPYLELGIDKTQADFIDSFLIFCLLEDSPQITDLECINIKDNRKIIVEEGRKPSLMLKKDCLEVPFAQYADQILAKISDCLGPYYSIDHKASILAQKQKIKDPSLTPSGMLLKDLKAKYMDYNTYILNIARRLKIKANNYPLSKQMRDQFIQEKDQSILDQSEIEKSDQGEFHDFLNKYNLEQQLRGDLVFRIKGHIVNGNRDS